MTESPSAGTPLGRLVLFMVCLSLVGSILAGAHYYAVDLPDQNAVQAPSNQCGAGCTYSHKECRDNCHGDRACMGRCIKTAQECARGCP